MLAAGLACAAYVLDALVLLDVVKGRLVQRLDADQHACEVSLCKEVKQLGVVGHVRAAEEERLLELEVLCDDAAAELLCALLVSGEVVILEVHVLKA